MEHKDRIVRTLALMGSIATIAQIIVNRVSGSSFCINDSCEIVEGLTIIAPFYLNPIDEIDDLDFEDLKRIPSFAPVINRQILSVLGIESIPVLVVKSAEGYRFIRGEKPIIDYVQHACFTKDEVLYLKKSFLSGEENITLLKDDAGECSIEIDCEQQQKD